MVMFANRILRVKEAFGGIWILFYPSTGQDDTLKKKK